MTSSLQNVLALVPDAFGGYGGISQYNRDFLSALALHQRIRQVNVLVRMGTSQHQDLPEKVQQDSPYAGKIQFSLEAFRKALSRNFNTIFCGHINLAPLAYMLSRGCGAKVWLQVHGVDAWYPLPRMARWAVERANLVTSVSRFTREKLLSTTDLDPLRVKVLPNTVRPMFSPGEASPSMLRQMGLTGRKVLITVSRLSRDDAYKGHAEVFRAMPRILQRHPDALYAIVGDGNGRADLEALAHRLGIQDQVRFLGRLDDTQLLALYRSCNVFVMPSQKEGFGIVFVEAARCGIPVIGGNRDGSVDALGEGAIGRLVDPTSAEAIAAAICETLTNPPPCTAEEAERFKFENFARHVHQLYDEHLGDSPYA